MSYHKKGYKRIIKTVAPEVSNSEPEKEFVLLIMCFNISNPTQAIRYLMVGIYQMWNLINHKHTFQYAVLVIFVLDRFGQSACVRLEVNLSRLPNYSA